MGLTAVHFESNSFLTFTGLVLGSIWFAAVVGLFGVVGFMQYGAVIKANLKQDNNMSNADEDERCCGTGTCLIDAQGRCWCGQQWDGTKMCMPQAQAPTLASAESHSAASLDSVAD
jgi:hypothetical protein